MLEAMVTMGSSSSSPSETTSGELTRHRLTRVPVASSRTHLEVVSR